jgi:hypothetical protein
VFFIPKLRSNIISRGQVTETGCDVLMKGNELMMHDKDGKLLMKVKRTPNRLYKIKLKVGSPVCIQALIE